MPHALVISIVQIIAVVFLIGHSAGLYYLNVGNVCLLGGRGLCALDAALSLVLMTSAVITAAFTLLLFKAYRYQ